MNIFHHRLDPDSARPIAVALSGGADSLLALIETLNWARDTGRPVIALSVDHQLQPQSREWAVFAAAAARRLGAQAEILAWTGPKPAAGLPAAARTARHRLIAAAARGAGARIIVTGHTASDAAENAAMGLGRLAEFSPSPVWPEGRGLFLLRPLLAATRAEVRKQLSALGETWIDDPANADLSHPRIRARQALAPVAPPPADDGAAALAAQVRFEDGVLTLEREAFRAAPAQARRKVLAAALICAGGGERPPRAEPARRLAERLCAPGDVSAALAGARIEAGETILIARNAGEFARKAPSRHRAAGRLIWDGRCEIAADGGDVVPAKGALSRLGKTARARLQATPAFARGAWPVLTTDRTAGPMLAIPDAPALRWLIPARFAGACGLIAHERQLSS